MTHRYLPTYMSHKLKVMSELEASISGNSGGGLVVTSRYCANPSSNPAEVYIFSVKILLEKRK